MAQCGSFGSPKRGTIVCSLTGHGLKDPDRAVDGIEIPAPIPAEKDALRGAMGWA